MEMILITIFILINSDIVYAKNIYNYQHPIEKQLNKFYEDSDSVNEHETINLNQIREIDNTILNRQMFNNNLLLAEEKKSALPEAKSNNIKDIKKDINATLTAEKALEPSVNMILGTYYSIRMSYNSFSKMNFSAEETSSDGKGDKTTRHLFSGNMQYKGMPAISIVVGEDKSSWYKYEIELGYIPLRVKGINELTTDIDANQGSNFAVSGSTFNMNIMNLCLNGFLKLPILDGKYVTFIGIGAGFGYTFPVNNTQLSSNFVFPFFQGFAGVTFNAFNRSKISIFWKLTYMNFSLKNKNAFPDANNVLSDYRSIQSGNLTFPNIIMNSIGIEYSFYN